MTPLFAAALDLQTFFERQGWKFGIIRGVALLRWGRLRFTRDIDVSLLTGFGGEDSFIDTLLGSGYRPRIPDAAAFARRNRVLLLDSPEGVPIDLGLAALPYEILAVERSSLFEYEPGCALRTCSAEDLMVQKLFANRAQDIADVESVADRLQQELDWDYIAAQLGPLAELKEDPAIMARLAALRKGEGMPYR